MAYSRVRVPGRHGKKEVIAVPPDWKDDKLNGYFIKLRRHLLKCEQCKGARKALIPDHMCRDGRQLTLSAADEFDFLIEMKSKALKHDGGLIYACPDISQHGKSYSLTAELFSVVGITQGLF